MAAVHINREGTYSLDPSKKPKEIDLNVEDGPPHERGVWKGIYELKGEELKLCFGPPNGDRPKEFVSEEATDPAKAVMLLKLKRVKE